MITLSPELEEEIEARCRSFAEKDRQVVRGALFDIARIALREALNACEREGEDPTLNNGQAQGIGMCIDAIKLLWGERNRLSGGGT